MATINRFEDLDVWQLARELAKDEFELTQKQKFSQDFGHKRQINDAAGSVMDNIAEGFDRGGNREFIQFLGFARGSCAEVRSQLYRARDKRYIAEQEFEATKEKAMRCSTKINNFMEYLRKSPIRGQKFK